MFTCAYWGWRTRGGRPYGPCKNCSVRQLLAVARCLEMCPTWHDGSQATSERRRPGVSASRNSSGIALPRLVASIAMLHIGQVQVGGNNNGRTLTPTKVTAWSELENIARASPALRACGAESVVGDPREAVYMGPGKCHQQLQTRGGSQHATARLSRGVCGRRLWAASVRDRKAVQQTQNQSSPR